MVAHSTGTAIAVHAGPGVAQDPCRVPAQPTTHHARTALVRLRLHLTDETGYPPGDAWLSSQRTALTTEGAVSSPSNGHQPAEKRVTGAKEMVGYRWDGAPAHQPGVVDGRIVARAPSRRTVEAGHGQDSVREYPVGAGMKPRRAATKRPRPAEARRGRSDGAAGAPRLAASVPHEPGRSDGAGPAPRHRERVACNTSGFQAGDGHILPRPELR